MAREKQSLKGVVKTTLTIPREVMEALKDFPEVNLSYVATKAFAAVLKELERGVFLPRLSLEERVEAIEQKLGMYKEKK